MSHKYVVVVVNEDAIHVVFKYHFFPKNSQDFLEKCLISDLGKKTCNMNVEYIVIPEIKETIKDS